MKTFETFMFGTVCGILAAMTTFAWLNITTQVFDCTPPVTAPIERSRE